MATPKISLPPSPPKHPLIGHLPEFLKNPRQFLIDSANTYGDIFCIYPPTGAAYVLTNLEHIEYVMLKNNQNFVKFKLYGMFGGILGKGLLTSEGDFWLRQRRLMQPAFARNILEKHHEIVIEMTNQLIETWQEGQIVDLYEEMMRHTLRVITKILFNVDISDQANTIGKAFDIAMDSLQHRLVQPIPLPDWIPTPINLKYKKALKQLNTLIYSIINERRTSRQKNEEQPSDLLSLLLKAQDTDGSRMTNLQIRDEVMTSMFAGHENTFIAIIWAFYLLAKNPEITKKLMSELDANKQLANLQDLESLKYTEAVVKETLRLYPPAWLTGRAGLKDCEIGGYKIPAGKQLWIPIWKIHHDARYYPEPEKFNPDRWLTPNPSLPKFAYMPFGGGPHLCIGNNFAMMEITTILAILLKKFQFQFQKEELIPVNTGSLRQQGEVKVKCEKRISIANQSTLT